MLKEIEPKKEPASTKVCSQCKLEFPFKGNKKYCSNFCRFKSWASKHPRIKIE